MTRRRSLEEWHRHPKQVAGIWWGLTLGVPAICGVVAAFITHRLTRHRTPS